jgi:hypothetical protein
MRADAKNASPILRIFDENGRPIVHKNRKPFRDPSGGCCHVLYALALTELLGNRRGLSKLSIRLILQKYKTDSSAGTWEWLVKFRPDGEDNPLEEKGEFGRVAIKNAIAKLRDEYPIIVLTADPNLHVPLETIQRSKGGKPPDIFVLNTGAILGWPCGAQIMKLVTSGIRNANPLRYSHLVQRISEQHRSHIFPPTLQDTANPPDVHTLRADIEFLVRTRYLKLFTHEKGDPRRKELKYSLPYKFKDDAVIEVDERAAWESSYFDKLSRHYVDPTKNI